MKKLSVIEDCVCVCVCVCVHVINKLSFPHLSCAILVLILGQRDLNSHGRIGS